MLSHRASCVLVVILSGCAGRHAGPTSPAKGGSFRGGIEAAGLPYQVLDARTGHQLDEPQFWSRLAGARAICIGEDHSNPHHHWAQLEIVKQLARRVPPGAQLALGLEMVQRPFQGVLDDYAANRIDAAALRSRAGWAERWGYDWGFYGPTIDAATAAGAKLLALNAPKELTKKVSRKGLDALTAEERAQVPELELEDAAHRAWFDALMEGMGGAHAHAAKKPAAADGEGAEPAEEPAEDPDGAHAAAMPSAERIYSVQVLWDETMADGVASWLAATPDGHAIILAGNGHCHDSAIVNRIKRRGIDEVVSVRPVIDTDGDVADVLARPMNDFAFVLTPPARSQP